MPEAIHSWMCEEKGVRIRPKLLDFQPPVVKEREGIEGEWGGRDLKHRMSIRGRHEAETHGEGRFLSHI